MMVITIIVAIMMVITITIAIWPEFLSPLASAAPAAPARWRPPAAGTDTAITANGIKIRAKWCQMA